MVKRGREKPVKSTSKQIVEESNEEEEKPTRARRGRSSGSTKRKKSPEPEPEPEKKPRRAPRRKVNEISKPEPEEVEEEPNEEEEKPARGRRGRSGGVAKRRKSPEPKPEPEKKPKRAPRGKAIETSKHEPEDVEKESNEEEEKATRGRRGRSSGSTKKKSLEPELQPEPEPEPEPEAEPEPEPEPEKKSRRAPRRKATETSKLKPEEVEEEVEKPQSAPTKSTRGRPTRAAAATVSIDSTDSKESVQPEPKRTTRGRPASAKKEAASKKEPVRATRSTRASARGKKVEATVSDDESEGTKEAAAKTAVSGVNKESQKLEKIVEESESIIEASGKTTSGEPEILPTVVDVIESIKEQVEKTVEDIQDLTQDEETFEKSGSKKDDNDKSSATRDSLDVNLDCDSLRELPEEDKSIDRQHKKGEKPTNEISISEIENDKTIGPEEAIDTKDTDQTVSIENGEAEVFKTSGDTIDNSMDKTVYDDSLNDIAQDETLPMESMYDKNGEALKRKSEDITDDSLTISRTKTVKKPRIRLLEVPDIPKVSGKVMTFGDDICGELGLKDSGMGKRRPVFVDLIEEPVVYITSGGMHNVCLTSNGQVYTWGCNDEGALGRETSNPPEGRNFEAEPTKVPFPVKIVSVSAGDSHSAALTSNGGVYIWGNFKDSNGKFGLTCESTQGQFQPIKIDIPNTNFVGLASGNDHLLLLTDTGEIYSFGVGEQGQLGRLTKDELRKREFCLKPSLVKFDDESIICDRVWAGQYSSYARTKTGEIYAWGLNNYSQLGVSLENKDDLNVPLPIRIPAFSKIDGSIEQICPGQHFMLARDSKGKVYSCGRHEYGRLGHGKKDESYDEPKLIEALEKECIKHIAAGSVTSFAVSDKGYLYAWGMSSYALGLGEDDAWIPTRVESKHLEKHKVIFVAAGSQHTAIIVQPKSD